MAVRPVLTYPDRRLRTLCQPVQPDHPSLETLIADLLDTMDASGHSVGIAAPQIGEMLRVIVIDCSQKIKNGLGRHVLLNPEIVEREEHYTMREGCMSLPDYVGIVTRARRVCVQAMDLNGHSLVLKAKKFEAIVLQHEIDHLNGILFIDRISSLKTDLIRRSPLQ